MQANRFHLAHRGSTLAFRLPRTVLRATSSNKRAAQQHSNAQARPATSVQRRLAAPTPLQQIAQEIDKHYIDIEHRKRAQQIQEQSYLLGEKSRDLNNLMDEEIKQNIAEG